MATYKTRDILDLLKIAGFEYVKSDNGSHQLYRHAKTGIEQPVAIHGKELNTHTTESIISYVLFTSYICGDDIQNNKKVAQNILRYMEKCIKNADKNIANIVPTDFRRRMGFASEDDIVKYIENLRKKINDKANVQLAGIQME